MLGFVFELLGEDAANERFYVGARYMGREEILHFFECHCSLKVCYLLVIPVPLYSTILLHGGRLHTIEVILCLFDNVPPALFLASDETCLVVSESLLSEHLTEELLAKVGFDA